MTGMLKERICSCSPLLTDSAIRIEDTTSLSSINGFFYDDPNISYTASQEHNLDQSPCYPVIAIEQGYFYCRLHPDVKNVHLESIEHHMKYEDPEIHKSELLKFLKLTHD